MLFHHSRHFTMAIVIMSPIPAWWRFSTWPFKVGMMPKGYIFIGCYDSSKGRQITPLQHWSGFWQEFQIEIPWLSMTKNYLFPWPYLPYGLEMVPGGLQFEGENLVDSDGSCYHISFSPWFYLCQCCIQVSYQPSSHPRKGASYFNLAGLHWCIMPMNVIF